MREWGRWPPWLYESYLNYNEKIVFGFRLCPSFFEFSLDLDRYCSSAVLVESSRKPKYDSLFLCSWSDFPARVLATSPFWSAVFLARLRDYLARSVKAYFVLRHPVVQFDFPFGLWSKDFSPAQAFEFWVASDPACSWVFVLPWSILFSCASLDSSAECSPRRASSRSACAPSRASPVFVCPPGLGRFSGLRRVLEFWQSRAAGSYLICGCLHCFTLLLI
jgi:hypothetical protein